MEDIVSIISGILKICLGKNGWYFWLAATLVLSLMWYIERINYWGYVALFSLLMTSFFAIDYIRDLIKEQNYQRRNDMVAQVNAEERQKKKEEDIFNFKNARWKVFAVADEENILAAVSLLDLGVIDKNPNTRFINYKQLQKENKFQKNMNIAVNYFYIPTDFGGREELITTEQNQIGIFIYFDPYLFQLLEYYKRNKERKFL